jgi:tetratricopeptide (TPR) repeat protein
MNKKLYLIILLLTIIVLTLNFFEFVLALNQTITQASIFQAQESIKKSQNAVNYMENLGLNTERVNDLLEEAKLFFKLEDYGRVVEIGKEINQLKETAILLSANIDKAKSLIESAKSIKLNVSSIEKQLSSGIEEFEINNYEEAQIKIDQSLNYVKEKLENESKNLISVLDNLNNKTIKKNITLNIINDLLNQLQNKLLQENLLDTHIIKKEILMLNTSTENLIKVKDDILEMLDNNLTTSRVDDLFKEALLAIELGNFDRANSIIQEIEDLKENAFIILNQINEVKQIIKDVELQGLDVTEAENLLSQGIDKFIINDYEEAEELLQKSIKKIEQIKTSSLLFGLINKSELKFSIITFLKAYWWAILIIILVLIIFGKITYDILYIKILNHRISNLKNEQEAIINLIKKYQEDYFKRKIISKTSYNAAVDKYQERLLKIKEKIPIIEYKLKNKEKKGRFISF